MAFCRLLLLAGLVQVRPVSGISKEVVAHVLCEVCEAAVAQASAYAKEQAIFDEDGLTDLVEGLCEVKRKEGRWITGYDIVREDEDSQLAIKKQATLGHCHLECSALQRACSQALKGKEESLTQLLKERSSVKELKKKVCKKSCGKTPPSLKKWVDEPFDAKDEKEIETEDLMEKMRAQTGLGMKMYKRDELMGMSEGDMETLAAREAYAGERAASQMAAKDARGDL